MNLVTPLCIAIIALSSAHCYCPTDQIIFKGPCNYRVECDEDINFFGLEDKCLGSSNYNTSIDINVNNAVEPIDKIANADVIQSITKLSITGNWPETNLSFLENMYQLKTLYIVRSGIKNIVGSPFRSLPLIETICLSHNNLINIEETFQFNFQSNRLKTLLLSNNEITNLGRDTFQLLTNLIELDLSHNYISDLTEEPFFNLTNLVTLRLNDNKIIDINGAMNNLLNLQHLYLMYNKITNIDEESIETIQHLETFDISKNYLHNLEPLVLVRHWYHFQEHTVIRIILSGNHIPVIPNAIADFTSRKIRNSWENRLVSVSTELILSENSINTIEYNAFESIKSLTSLDLSINRLNTFFVNPEHIQHMLYLNLSSNMLTTLHYGSFSYMKNLQNLDLSNNMMNLFPDQQLSSNENLKSLNLTSNYITEVYHPQLKFLNKMGILDLTNNSLTNLIISEDETYGLNELILSYNNIHNANYVQLNKQRHLKILHMNHNHIQMLKEDSLQLPVTLIFLDLSYNEIGDIQASSFHRLSQLQTLFLSHNTITALDYGMFSGLSSLLNLDLSHNKISVLDSKYLLDLKSLEILSVRHNLLNFLDYNSWLTHKVGIKVYLDGNSYSCDWLAKALSDFNNGYSMMQPASRGIASGQSILDIPCIQDDQRISTQGGGDDRLLITSQKILQVVQEQTFYLRKLFKIQNTI